jgi:hypothetical protein
MAHASPPPAAGPKPWVKWLVSLVIFWQFFAILSVVTASGNAPWQPSVIVFNYVTKPYLESVFLTNAYRFYAPDPGPIDLLWFRIEYENGAVRWYDMADREQFTNRMPFQRHVSLTMMIQQMSSPDPTGGPGTFFLRPQAVITLQSYVRHFAQTKATKTPEGEDNLVKEVDVYHVSHVIMLPKQIRMGWESDDLRLHKATFLGTYDPNGNRLSTAIDPLGAERPYQTRGQPMSVLAMQIIGETQAMLEFEDKVGDERLKAVQKMHLPAPIRNLIVRFPELLDPAPPDTTPLDRIKKLVESRDDPDEKRTAVPEIEYFSVW